MKTRTPEAVTPGAILESDVLPEDRRATAPCQRVKFLNTPRTGNPVAVGDVLQLVLADLAKAAAGVGAEVGTGGRRP